MTDIDAAVWEDYLARTRWFSGKGRPFRVSSARVLADLTAPGLPNTTVALLTVAYDDDEKGEERYQVPFSSYDEPQDRLAHAQIGTVQGHGRARYLYDAVHDREAMAHWLTGFVDAEPHGSRDAGGLSYRRVSAGTALDPALRSSPLSGEQSNSSVRFDDVAIMKVFRKVSPGVNPDIEIHDELTRAGSTHIAALYGWVEADADGETFQLAMLQEFLNTAADGFELAMGSVRALLADPEQDVDGSGGDFAGEAARLGEALAEIHVALSEHFPAERLGRESIAHLAGTMRARLDGAARIVPGLAALAPRLHELYDAVAASDGLDVQRIHGDLHLGQTLRTARGWRIVDFEGEPGRAFAERALPDSPWRDVAGMVRSFDYATGVVEMAQSGTTVEERGQRSEQARQWSERARRGFIDAYVAARTASGDLDESDESDGDAHTRLLEAYIADKAVYEAVYETRNRPAWTAIPLAALSEIAGR